MPNGVREELINLAMKFGNMNNEDAEIFISQLEKNNRYQLETWA